jgi:hypothetical protein
MTNDAASDVYPRPMLRSEFLKHSLLLLMIVGASCLLRPGGELSPLAAPGHPNPR